jgi:hypothetical protein
MPIRIAEVVEFQPIANKARAGGDDAEGNEISEYIVEHIDMLTRKSICWFCGRSNIP